MSRAWRAAWLCVLVCAAVPAEAQLSPPLPSVPAEVPAAGSDRAFGLRVGADVPLLSGFIFRGFIQEFRPRLTVQPYAELALRLTDNVALRAGGFASFHTGSIRQSIGPFYAFDPYAALTYRSGRWIPGVMYALYTSPS